MNFAADISEDEEFHAANFWLVLQFRGEGEIGYAIHMATKKKNGHVRRLTDERTDRPRIDMRSRN